MAGDWIKMRMDLQDDPAVISMADELDIDEFSIIGRLHKLWTWADRQLSDGHAKAVTRKWIDRYVVCDRFAECMENAGWLILDETGVTFPNFDKHNGESAKIRAEATERKRKSRLSQTSVTDMSQQSSDKTVTREEKRREELTTSPLPPSTSKKKNAVALKTFITECKAKGEKPIPDEDPVFDYAQQAGIPSDFLWLQWREFIDRYCVPDAKRYKDWRSVFNKSVRGNWFKIWYIDGSGEYVLTTVGVQAQNTHKGKAA